MRRRKTVMIWGETGHLQAKETGIRGHQLSQHLDLGFIPSRTMRKMLFKPLSLWYFAMAALEQ